MPLPNWAIRAALTEFPSYRLMVPSVIYRTRQLTDNKLYQYRLAEILSDFKSANQSVYPMKRPLYPIRKDCPAWVSPPGIEPEPHLLQRRAHTSTPERHYSAAIPSSLSFGVNRIISSATTSVPDFSVPSCPCHVLVRRRPSMYTFDPLTKSI